ncbi:hypothetical protein Tco_0240469, partial [Tanacetum coccineum]
MSTQIWFEWEILLRKKIEKVEEEAVKIVKEGLELSEKGVEAIERG